MFKRQSDIYEKLNFQLKRNGRKYSVICAVCGAELKNTAAERLRTHRNICYYDEGAKNKIEPKEDYHVYMTTVHQQQTESQPEVKFEPQALMPFEKINIPSTSTAAIPPIPHFLQIPSRSRSANNFPKISGCVSLHQNKESQQNAEINQALCKFIYGCGMPFNITQSNSFRDLIGQLRQSYVNHVPTGNEIATTLLDDEYEHQIDIKVGTSNSVLLINTKNDQNKGVAVLYGGPNKTQKFLKIWDMETTSNVNDLFKMITKLIDYVKMVHQSNVYAVVVDDIPMANHGASNLTIWFIVCSHYMANLIAEELFNKDLDLKIQRVIKELKNMDLPRKRNWRDHKNSLLYFIENMEEFKRIVATSRVEISEYTKQVLSDELIKSEIGESFNRLNRISDLIAEMKNTKLSISDTVNLWLTVPSPIYEKTDTETSKIKPIIFNKYALAAYYINPLYANDKLQPKQWNSVIDFVLGNLEADGITEWMKFTRPEGHLNTLLESEIKNVETVWTCIGEYLPNLAEFAVRLIRIPASVEHLKEIASIEISNTFNKENDLSPEQSQKLLYVRNNLKLNESSGI